uniref:Uncharacterized protein n=1 Tax=Timema bartmani TaxID=61472 RepID=A0A7R9I011_9NEOP|nr:unnamed protein product [Timema bartmani]
MPMLFTFLKVNQFYKQRVHILLIMFCFHACHVCTVLSPRLMLRVSGIACISKRTSTATLDQVQRNLALCFSVTGNCNRSGVTLLLVSLSQAALEQVQSNFAPRLCHRLRCNRSGATLFLYAPEISWSIRTVERKWVLCVLITALRSETRLENDKDTLEALKELSTFFTENTLLARRNLRSKIEKRSIVINEVNLISMRDNKLADKLAHKKLVARQGLYPNSLFHAPSTLDVHSIVALAIT